MYVFIQFVPKVYIVVSLLNETDKYTHSKLDQLYVFLIRDLL